MGWGEISTPIHPMKERAKKVVFVTPTRAKPSKYYLESLEATVPLLEERGWDHGTVFEVGCPYISHARATALRKALDADATVVVFIDDDLSWKPKDMLKLLETDGDVVSGVYRFKKEPEEYMGQLIVGDEGTPIVREDGCVLAHSIPAGFLKVTRNGINKFMREYPELVYDEPTRPSVDLFNHGAYQGVWWGEDYAFARRWRDKCGQVWIVPDLDLVHWAQDKPYPGNFHEFLLRQPGGSKEQK